jgi:putative endonuclease
MLRCGNGDVYTGVTTDLERRFREHRSGIGGRFTRAFQPVELVYSERAPTETEAKRREAQLKSWSRSKKLALIAGERNTLKRA